MADPVKVITQAESWRQEVKDDVVSCLRRLLERAENGEIKGLAFSCSTIDNMVMTGFTKDTNRSAMIGGLERVKHRMLAGED